MRLITNTDFDFKRSLIVYSNQFSNYLNTDIQGELILLEEDSIRMLVILKRKLFFKLGYCIHPPLKNGEKLTELEESNFYKSLQNFLSVNKMLDFIYPPIHLENFYHIPNNSKGNKIGIIRLILKNKTSEEIFNSFKPIYRNLIKKAQKEGVVVKFGMECFDDFYKLYKDKLVLEKAPFDSYTQIYKLAMSLSDSGRSICAVAYLNNIPDAAIVNINDDLNAYYLWAGTSNNSHAGSLRLLHWEIIQKYIELGIENYRMGAARDGDMLNEKHARLLKFKLGFGSQIDDGYNFTFISNKFKYSLFNLLLKIKSIIR